MSPSNYARAVPLAPSGVTKMSAWDRASHAIPVLFGSVIGANVLTMSIMNFFEAPTKIVSIVYLACLGFTSFLMLRCKVEFPCLSKAEHLFCFGFGLILFLPRVPYLLEHLLGYALIPIGDDGFHIPNLASIIHTPQFPPKSTYDNREYLAYYYAAWIPGAAFYYTGLISTVKQALALLKLLYCFFIAYFPVYASKVLFSNSKLRVTFLILCFLYGGFDFVYWVSSLNFVPSHSEWWAADFGIEVQFSNFFTLALWTPQHLLSGLSILYAMFVLSKSDRAVTYALAGLFFLSGLFSSPFATFGTLPLLLWFFIRFRKLRAALLSGLVFLIVSLPLWWILVGNERVGLSLFGALIANIWIEHKRAAFAVFLLVIALELWPLIIGAALAVKDRRELRWPFFLSVLYLLSTFFLFFSENYSMRGSIVPIFTLIYLATPTALSWYEKFQPTPWRYVMVVYLLGGVLEYASFSKMAVESLEQSNTPFNAAALRSNSNSDELASMELTREAERRLLGWQVLEKGKPEPKANIDVAESRQMHPDNRYRLTLSRILTRHDTGL